MSVPIPSIPFDPELVSILESFGPAFTEPLTLERILSQREFFTTPTADVDAQLAAVGAVRRDVTVTGYQGADIVLSIISLADRVGTGPGIFHTHGGGMVSGDRFTGLPQFLPWVVELGAVVVTVEYRLAPEFPDPYPIEDCYAGLLWVAEHLDELGIDPGRLLVAGASAGGGLAAGTALLARDRRGPELAGQLLIYPMLDDRDSTVSTAQIDGRGVWDRASNRVGWQALLGDRSGTENVSVYAAPARADDLGGLPQAFIECGSAEVFRDEDVAYATSLWQSGVQAELHVWPGGFHGFDGLAPDSALSRSAIAARNSWVARILA